MKIEEGKCYHESVSRYIVGPMKEYDEDHLWGDSYKRMPDGRLEYAGPSMYRKVDGVHTNDPAYCLVGQAVLAPDGWTWLDYTPPAAPCEHVWVDTGGKRSWCKHCNVDAYWSLEFGTYLEERK